MDFSLTGIDHVVLRTANVDTMLAFYQSVLGAELERQEAEFGLYQLRAGSSLIDIVDCAGELGRRGGAAPDHGAPNMDHFCLRLRPWRPDALRSWLQQHGVSPSTIENRYGAEGTAPSLYISDPDGNTIELKAARDGGA